MSGIEIRPYEGDGRDLADLAARTWQRVYTGKMWFPIWDHAYFSWRLLDDRVGERAFLQAAYRGQELIGSLLAEPLDLRVGDQITRGSLSSWLSVDPEVRNPTVGMRLYEGLRRLHQERGMSMSIGCTSLDATLPNRKFWQAMARRNSEDIRHLRPMYFWTRVFDTAAVARAGLSAFDKLGSVVSGTIPWAWLGWRTGTGIRPYAPADLPRCAAWLESQAEGADISIQWDQQRLEQQLDHPSFATTLVADGENGQGAFLNYYPIGFAGATTVRAGVIDLFAGDIGLARQVDLLKAAGLKMIEDGIQMAMMLVSEAAPTAALLAAGFLPKPADQELFCIFPDPKLALPDKPRLHILFS